METAGNMSLKQKVYAEFLGLLLDKIAAVEQVLADLKETGSNETKSTAGDKHETALAMLQIEQANTRAQLQELQGQQSILGRIDPGLSPEMIVTGSLIKTNRGYFFMSTALGKRVIADKTVTALSGQSPLGQKLMGAKAGDRILMNETEYLIESIS